MMGSVIILLIFGNCIYEGNLSIVVTNYFVFGVYSLIIMVSLALNTFLIL